MIPGRGAVWFSVPEWGSELRGFGKVSIILRNLPEPLILLRVYYSVVIVSTEILKNAYSLNLKGESMRKLQSDLT